MKQIFYIVMLLTSFLMGQKLAAQNPVQGGGIYAEDAQITSSVISNNMSQQEGTGVYANGVSTLVNNTIVGNMQTFDLAVGQVRDGGVVFYVDVETRTGLIVALTEAPVNATAYYRTWGESSQDITGATSPEDGKANHDGIIAAQVIRPDIDVCRDNDITKAKGGCKPFTLPADTARRAAHWCEEYKGGNNPDWFLPSREQLKKLYVVKATVNATLSSTPNATPLNDGNYWSSTQADAYEAWYVYFDNGEVNRSVKSNTANVRAIREFSF